MTPEQCRQARELLGWTRIRLASRAGRSDATIKTFETGQCNAHVLTRQAIRSALEAAGVEFIYDNGSGPGVRMKKASL